MISAVETIGVDKIDVLASQRSNIRTQELKLRTEFDSQIGELRHQESKLTSELLDSLGVRKHKLVEDETVWKLVDFASQNGVDPRSLLTGYMEVASRCSQHQSLLPRRTREKTTNPDLLRDAALRWISVSDSKGPFIHEAQLALTKAIEVLNRDLRINPSPQKKLDLVLDKFLLENLVELSRYSNYNNHNTSLH